MASLLTSHDEHLEDITDGRLQARLDLIVRDYNGTITTYKKVKNAFLKAMYNLKKEEYISKHGAHNVKEKTLIHSTAVDNVLGIIRDNFDWRRVVRSKYGTGVSFSDDADYANCHSNRLNGSARAFIICKVLMSQRMCGGSQNLKIPPLDCDTSYGPHVYVKFRDNEFLPKYVLYYNCSSITTSKYYRRRRSFLF